MSEDGDSWLSNAFGFDVGGAAQKLQDGATAVVADVGNAVADVVPSGIDPGALRNDLPPVVVPPATPPPFTPPLAPPVVTPPPITPTPPGTSILTEAAEFLLEEAGADATVTTVATAGVGLGGALLVGGGAFVVGAAAPFIIGYGLQRSAELDQQADPDEQSLPGGVGPDLSPDGGVDPPQTPTPAIDPATGQPVAAPGTPGAVPAVDPGNPGDAPLNTAPEQRGQRRPNEKHFDEDDPRNPGNQPERISDGNKEELMESGWLKGRYPDVEDRREFMDWLKTNHKIGEEHTHLRPGSPEAEAALEEWEKQSGRRR